MTSGPGNRHSPKKDPQLALMTAEPAAPVLTAQLCVDVAVPLPVSGLFSYTVPAGEEARAQVGVRVQVPFKNRELIGYIVAKKMSDGKTRLKSLFQILDDEPVINDAMLALTKWIGEEYGSSWGEAIENALPRWIKYGKKAERAIEREKKITAEMGKSELTAEPDFVLTPDQIKATEVIRRSLEASCPKPVLLYGVTGSGKSEIYIRTIREVLSRNRSVICLVPEIALTEQLRLFFYRHFGEQLEILHSKLNDTERFLAWKRLESGERRVVLGPRSAVFAPLPDLGLILMDEEHEGSYKQETVPRYHAREVAAWRAAHEKALFVMGTATPSLETMFASEKGDIVRVDLTTRVDNRAMPEVKIIDMKREAGNHGKRSLLSINLIAEIERNLQNKEGTLLLLNRRGFSTHIYNSKTGDLMSCRFCQVSLTYHQEEDVLLCHYCNFKIPVAQLTAGNDAGMVRFSGFGTEKIESVVAQRWPQARIARLDTDSIRKKGSHEKILQAFRDQKIDILIGTQMIAKGFDFPHVTLVGVVLADVGLMLPDFRSSERTFQLLTQVAGRAGRGQKPGRVLIQTFSPHHPSIRYAKEHDYMSFYQQEIPSRREYGYPPYAELINFIIRSRDEKKAYLFAREWRDLLKEELEREKALFEEVFSKISVIGPSPLPFYKLRGHFRWHVMIKAPRRDPRESPSEKSGQPGDLFRTKLWEILSKLKKSSSVAMAVDVNPVNIL